MNGKPIPGHVRKVLLKDIIVPHLPSPYYHFEYGTDSSIKNVSFASNFTDYDVFYDGDRISEMRNNIIVNHDTLRYYYDNTGKVSMINFIKTGGTIFRHVLFTYGQNQLRQINWDHLDTAGFITDRTVTLTYFSDGNLQELIEHRPGSAGQPDVNSSTQFSDYDDKTNVDDFTLLQDGFHDHIFLLARVRLQKNNPRKVIFTGDSLVYTGTYAYTYNQDGSPLTKNGDVVFTQGPQNGQTFHDSEEYVYY